MRKIYLNILCFFIILLPLCACKNTSIYDVKIDGVSYEVNSIDKTINDGNYTYQYSFSGNKAYYTIRITYPDNFEYTYTNGGQSGTGSWNGKFNSKYTNPEILCDVVLADSPKPINGELIFAKIIGFLALAGIGIFEFLFPDVLWKLRWRWAFKNPEPSEAYLAFSRIIAIVMIIAGVILLFV